MSNVFRINQAANPKHRVIVAFPFSPELSKNKQHGVTRHGKIYTRPQHKRQTEQLEVLLREACAGHEWKKAKYWVAIHVEKPHNRLDAPNFVDAICDVVKKAVGVDDCWMELERVSYEVYKGVPVEDLKIYISIAQ